MKHSLAALILLAGAALPALAQDPQPFPSAPTGQNYGGVRADAWYANTSTAGFGASTLSSVAGAGTTQATATDILTTNTIITACPAGGGVQLPNIERTMALVVMNRSGGVCNVYPTPNGTIESAPGTVGAVNAPFAMPVGTMTFRMVSPTAWNQ